MPARMRDSRTSPPALAEGKAGQPAWKAAWWFPNRAKHTFSIQSSDPTSGIDSKELKMHIYTQATRVTAVAVFVILRT